MTLQAALGAVLLIGLPLVLLALGVLAHAYYVARPRAAARNDRLIEELVAESVDQLIAQLQADLPRRPALAPMTLRAALGAPALAAPTATHPTHSFASLAAPTAASAARTSLTAPSLRGAVAQLLSEGLSDRSIARRLGIGIEEVRAARINGTAGPA